MFITNFYQIHSLNDYDYMNMKIIQVPFSPNCYQYYTSLQFTKIKNQVEN